ncbi:ParB N-terminal domain-containing protein [Thomasclavelia cocleata]|uniref:ParB N-terminal domain-containing protein n=1 Tax=Thomasclavelia cocleata TaxID=69824 RepID=UPI002570E466|nr:ParB N-terminal domain-containing protein [Thomasclavelia cocleata]
MSIEVKMFKTSEIKPYKNNPRNNDDAVNPVMESIKQFGFKVPIVIDKNNVVVAGHTRLKAAIKLKLAEVPCIVADDLTEEQINAFRLADNKVSEFATWDFELLDIELDNIAIDMSTFGFLNIDILDDELEKQMEYLTQDTKIKKHIVKLTFMNEDEAIECKDKLMSLGYENVEIV